MEMTVEKGRRTHRQNPQGTRRTHDRPRGKQKKGERGGKDDRTPQTLPVKLQSGRLADIVETCLKRGNLGTPTFGSVLSAKDRDTRTHTQRSIFTSNLCDLAFQKPEAERWFKSLQHSLDSSILRILQSFSYVLGKIELCNCATQNIIVQSAECKGE